MGLTLLWYAFRVQSVVASARSVADEVRDVPEPEAESKRPQGRTVAGWSFTASCLLLVDLVRSQYVTAWVPGKLFGYGKPLAPHVPPSTPCVPTGTIAHRRHNAPKSHSSTSVIVAICAMVLGVTPSLFSLCLRAATAD
jgi:hypothetical protein